MPFTWRATERAAVAPLVAWAAARLACGRGRLAKRLRPGPFGARYSCILVPALLDGGVMLPYAPVMPRPPKCLAPPRPRPASWWCTWCDSPRRSCCHDGDTDGGGGVYTPASHRVTTPAPWLAKPSTAVGGAGVPRAAHMASLWPRRPRRCTAGGPLEECRGAPLVVQLWSRRCHVAPGSIRSPALHRLQWQRRLEPGAEPLELARRRGALRGTLRP